MEGYTLMDKKCEKCPDNFATCSSKTNGTLCMMGYYKTNTTCT